MKFLIRQSIFVQFQFFSALFLLHQSWISSVGGWANIVEKMFETLDRQLWDSERCFAHESLAPACSWFNCLQSFALKLNLPIAILLPFGIGASIKIKCSGPNSSVTLFCTWLLASLARGLKPCITLQPLLHPDGGCIMQIADNPQCTDGNLATSGKRYFLF